MKSTKKQKISYKKYIIGSILAVLTIVTIVCFAIGANAETDDTEAIKDEKTLVKMSALISKGKAANDKVNSGTLAEILENYAGNGKTEVTEKDANTLVVKFLETGREYEVDTSIGVSDGNSNDDEEPITGLLPSTAYTTPYMPSGFHYAEGDLNTGLVIADSSGNEYVWVEVPRTTTVYPTAGLNITGFSSTDYTNIENDLHTYTTVYRGSTSYSDIHSGDDTSTGLTSTQYTEMKQKMLKSVYKSGGFYIGRYEAGIDTNRTSHSSISSTLVPTSKENQYPLTNIYCSEAQTLASRVLPTESTYTSSLMFGVQWDLVLKYLETKGATQEELKGTTTGSTNWGNYYNSTYTLNRGKYRKSSTEWPEYTTDYTGYVRSSVKEANKSVLYTTGASDQNRKQNIYDLAGNVWEWTLEYTSDTSYPCAGRGGSYNSDGSGGPASYRSYYRTPSAYSNGGFRVVLY